MKSPHQTLQHLISHEILVEIQAMFLKKHGALVSVYDHKMQSLLVFPENVPALAALSKDQQNLFESFFNLSSLTAEQLQSPITQSFGGSTIWRSVFPLVFQDEFLGLVVLVRFVKIMHPNDDEQLLQTLSLVKYKNVSLKTVQDDTKTADDALKVLGQELQNTLHLFLEAGAARAHVSDNEVEPQPVSISNATDAILFCAPDGQIVDSIQNAAEFLGYEDTAELCELNFLNDLLATSYDREKIRMLFEVPHGTTTSVAVNLKDGTAVQVDVQVKVQRTASGIVGFECLLSPAENLEPSSEDETTQHSSTLYFDENHLETLQKSYHFMQREISHITSPLVKKLGKFFAVDVKDEAIKKELSEIHRLTKSLTHINQQLACFALQNAPDRESIDLKKLLQKVAAQLENRVPSTITIQTHLTQGRIFANPELIVHAVGNLCKNAIDAMPNGGTLTIETRLDDINDEKDHLSICIGDSGPGIPHKIQKSLFEPFSSTQKHPGAGLGLAAVYGIAKSHGAHVSVWTREKRGTTIFLRFPIETKPAKNESSRHVMDAASYVLIVDDEQDIADVTAMALRRAGYGVFTSATCDDALNIIKMLSDKIDLIILDNQLVGTKGVTCAQDMLSTFPKIPILFYSGADDDPELMSFIKQTGAGWLKKPFTAKDLLAKVNSLILEQTKK